MQFSYMVIFLYYPTNLNLIAVYVGLFSLVECSKEDHYEPSLTDGISGGAR